MNKSRNQPILNIYIDTNAYLTFFHLTSDDLEELKKLSVLIDKKIYLHLPEQTRDEFYRNRETKIADALKRFREDKLTNQFPQMSKQYTEYKKMKAAIKDFEQSKSKLLEKLHDAILSKKLDADIILDSLFTKAKIYDTTEELIKISRDRFDLGKPPGKGKSYGDALNWETLLSNLPDGEDLYFISDDKDYFSEIDQTCFNSYLIAEWEKRKGSKIYAYRRISEFFKEKFPEIEMASEYEKDHLIQELSMKRNFAGARSVLHKLSAFESFSNKQLNDFVEACVNNTQVYWIADDADIKQIISEIVLPNKKELEPALQEEFHEKFNY